MTQISLITGPNTSGHNRACNSQETAENFLLDFPIRTGREQFSFRVTKPGHMPPHMEKAHLPEEKRKPAQGSAGVCLLSAKVHSRLLLSIMRTFFLRVLVANWSLDL